MKTNKIIFLIFFLSSCQWSIKNENSKALESIKSYTQDEFFKNGYSIEIFDFKINSVKEVRRDSISLKLVESKIYDIAFKIADPSLKNYSNFDIKKLNSEVLKQAYNSVELKEYISRLKKHSNESKAYIINIYSKFIATHTNSGIKNNIFWPDQTFILSEDYSILDAPTMFKN